MSCGRRVTIIRWPAQYCTVYIVPVAMLFLYSVEHKVVFYDSHDTRLDWYVETRLNNWTVCYVVRLSSLSKVKMFFLFFSVSEGIAPNSLCSKGPGARIVANQRVNL